MPKETRNRFSEVKDRKKEKFCPQTPNPAKILNNCFKG
jgi:hypothetical protein